MRRTDLLYELDLARNGSLLRKTTRGDDNGYTFTRASTGSMQGSSSVMWASSGSPRVEWQGSVPYLLVEPAATNMVDDSRVEQWTATNATRTDDQTAPDGTASAVLVTDSTAGNAGLLAEPISFSTVTNRAISFYAKRSSTGDTPVFRIRATTASATRGQIQIAWTSTGGVSSLTASQGATLLGSTVGTPAGSGWHRVRFQPSSGLVDTQTNQAQFLPASTAAANTGAAYLWGVQAEATSYATSFVGGTTAAASTRVRDLFYSPFLHPPQAMTAYVKLREVGGSAGSGVVLHLGSSAAAASPRLTIAAGSTGSYVATWTTTGGSLASTVAGAPAVDATVELRAVLNANGSIQLGRSVNSAAETLGTASTAGTLPSAWVGTRLYLGTGGTTGVGNPNPLGVVRIARGVRSLAEMRAV